jgi:hypothetical protein
MSQTRKYEYYFFRVNFEMILLLYQNYTELQPLLSDILNLKKCHQLLTLIQIVNYSS